MSLAPVASRGVMIPALLASLALGLAGPSLAASPLVQVATGPSSALHREWVERIHEARSAVEKARVEEKRATLAYGLMRRRQKLRGEKRAEIVRQRDAAHEARRQAEQDLEALIERARRENVPPGWVREAMDGFQEVPSAAPA